MLSVACPLYFQVSTQILLGGQWLCGPGAWEGGAAWHCSRPPVPGLLLLLLSRLGPQEDQRLV